MSNNQQLQACPGCNNTQSIFGEDSELGIYRCSCGKVYCDKCSAGGLITLPRCPVSPHHEGMQRVGSISRAKPGEGGERARDLGTSPRIGLAVGTPELVPLNRSLQPTAPTLATPDDAAMVHTLTELARYYANGGLSRDNPEIVEEVLSIGRRLNGRGGIAEMRRIFAMVPPMQGKRTVEMEWDGIGDWRG